QCRPAVRLRAGAPGARIALELVQLLRLLERPMIFRGLLALALASASLAAQAAFDLDQLMGELARHPGGQARFVETRTMALLDRPVRSSGEMRYTPPDRLEKRTLQPRAETLILDKDTLT